VSSAPSTVDVWSIAVVCSGIGSGNGARKHLAEGVQPCEPCIIGMARLSRGRPSEAPTGWLTFNGLTASALLRLTISGHGSNANQTRMSVYIASPMPQKMLLFHAVESMVLVANRQAAVWKVIYDNRCAFSHEEWEY